MADFLRDPSVKLAEARTGLAAAGADSSDDLSAGVVTAGPRRSCTVQKQLEENCGVFGVVGKENASRTVFFGLYALNHRESRARPASLRDGEAIPSTPGSGR